MYVSTYPGICVSSYLPIYVWTVNKTYSEPYSNHPHRIVNKTYSEPYSKQTLRVNSPSSKPYSKHKPYSKQPYSKETL